MKKETYSCSFSREKQADDGGSLSMRVACWHFSVPVRVTSQKLKPWKVGHGTAAADIPVRNA